MAITGDIFTGYIAGFTIVFSYKSIEIVNITT